MKATKRSCESTRTPVQDGGAIGGVGGGRMDAFAGE